jgi:hypothetical protein
LKNKDVSNEGIQEFVFGSNRFVSTMVTVYGVKRVPRDMQVKDCGQVRYGGIIDEET